MDIHTKEERSRNMSAIRGYGNKSTEQKFLTLLKENKLFGWRRHKRNLPGSPDFIFSGKKLAIFIHGCFWHGCRKHCTYPKTNKLFWKKKIDNNIQRDKRVLRRLKNQGWMVLVVWEHQIKKDFSGSIEKIIKFLK